MDEPIRRCVVTGARSPLGRRILDVLHSLPMFEHVRGVEPKASKKAAEDGEIDIVPFKPDHRPFAEYLAKNQIDSVIHCGLVPDRTGLRSTAREADVIGTMCLGAAIAQDSSPVRSWVLVSSSSIYPIDSYSALYQSEASAISSVDESLASSIAEAEDYARDVAFRHPHLNVAILRLQQVVGNECRGALDRLLARDPVPVPIGFDPPIQLLHLEDAVDAVVFAARRELAGVYNVASEGLIHWRDAVRATGRSGFPVLPASSDLLAPVLDRIGVPNVPSELLDLLRFGHAIDTHKLTRAGWRAKHDQPSCLASIEGISKGGRTGGRARR